MKNNDMPQEKKKNQNNSMIWKDKNPCSISEPIVIPAAWSQMRYSVNI